MLGGLQPVVDAVQRAEFRNELEGGLLSDAGDTGDVVRAIPHECLHVHELVGTDAVLLHEGGLVGVGGGGVTRQQDVDAGGDELEGVLVSREKVGHAILGIGLGHGGQGAQDIVGLVALHVQNVESQHFRELAGYGHLGAKLVGHGVAASLVSVVHFMSEGGGFQVVGDHRVVGLQCLQLAGDDVDQAVEGVGGKAVLGGEQADAVEGAVEDTVAVYAKELFHGGTPFLCGLELFYYYTIVWGLCQGQGEIFARSPRLFSQKIKFILYFLSHLCYNRGSIWPQLRDGGKTASDPPVHEENGPKGDPP